MDVRVDLEHLKHLAQRVQALETEARRLRLLYGEMLIKCQALRNTLESLAVEYGFDADLTPTHMTPDFSVIESSLPEICSKDASVAIKGIKTCP